MTCAENFARGGPEQKFCDRQLGNLDTVPLARPISKNPPYPSQINRLRHYARLSLSLLPCSMMQCNMVHCNIVILSMGYVCLSTPAGARARRQANASASASARRGRALTQPRGRWRGAASSGAIARRRVRWPASRAPAPGTVTRSAC